MKFRLLCLPNRLFETRFTPETIVARDARFPGESVAASVTLVAPTMPVIFPDRNLAPESLTGIDRLGARFAFIGKVNTVAGETVSRGQRKTTRTECKKRQVEKSYSHRTGGQNWL